MKTKPAKHSDDELTDAQAIKQLRKIGARIKALAKFSDEELISELRMRWKLAGALGK
jgi:hypothetical protein